jgi:hypothetical protein
MKRLLKYLVVLLIVLVCVYGFWLWLQYKWATVIKKTTASIMTELKTVEKLETVSKSFTNTIEGQQELVALLPDIGVDQIISSALFSTALSLEVEWIVSAWYTINNIATGDIQVSRDGTVTMILREPEIFWVTLTGELQTTKLGIVTKSEIDMENKLREKAGEQMIQEALSGGILEEAKSNAQSTLQDLFLKASIQIKEVIIKGTGDKE